MQHTNIEWVRNTDGSRGFSWNPYAGCNGPENKGPCPYCYGLAWAKRFNKGDFSPTWHPERLDEPLRVKKASRIFCGSITDLFGEWVEEDYLDSILDVIGDCEFNEMGHTFYVLTKQPQNIARKLYSAREPFMTRRARPESLWLGVSVTCDADLWRIGALREAWGGRKFVSFEPLHSMDVMPVLTGMEWCILGSQSNPRRETPYGATTNVFTAAALSSIPIFVKDNLHPWTGRRPQKWPPT